MYRFSRIVLCVAANVYAERSIYRPRDVTVPEISVAYTTGGKAYELRSPYMRYWPIFNTFDRDYFFSHQLPREMIPYRTEPERQVSGEELAQHAEDLLRIVRSSRRIKKEMGNFIILKSCDFNPRTSSGLIVARLKNHPFVIKLFIETPESFVRPFSKGFEPGCMFVIGGGVSRFLAGFTRVKNAEYMRNYFERNPIWNGVLDLPRKWFWIPQSVQWLTVRGKNFYGEAPFLEIELPSVYAIFCDAIDSDRSLSLRNKHERRFALGLSQDLNNRLDPHINNFVIEKDSGLIVIIDTEHFPTMVGLEDHMIYKSYASWYVQLFLRGFCARYCTTKKVRRECSKKPAKDFLRV